MTPRANYHTHTRRCGHAGGTDREYVERAIEAGFTTLGFSDHAPMPFPDGHESGFRVPLAKTADYFASLRALRDEYRDRITIYVGLEVEYYPALFPAFLDYIAPFAPDYLLLAQHFLDETESVGSFADTQDPARLQTYYARVLEGVKTGKFLYVAHPDVFHYTGDEAAYDDLTRDFLREIVRTGIPLELNRLGMSDGRIYPRPRFWQLAGEAGARAVVGMDAHMPAHLLDRESEDACRALAERCGVTVSDSLAL